MLSSGDELSRTQNGNNNGYCQDNELTWLNWSLTPPQQHFLDFVKRVTQIWREQPVFHRKRFFQGRAIRGSDIKDISWFEMNGTEMTEEAWNVGFAKCLGVRLAGDLIGNVNERGEPIVGDTVLLLLNAHHEPLLFTLPGANEGEAWQRLLDTAEPDLEPHSYAAAGIYPLQGRSMVVMRLSVEEPGPLTAGSSVATPQVIVAPLPAVPPTGAV
jgi:isoamylase